MSLAVSWLDFGIVLFYLVLTLGIGIWSAIGRHRAKSLKEYSLGGRQFTTTTLVATMVASLLAAGSTIGFAQEVYSVGIIMGAASLGYTVSIIITNFILRKNIFYFKGNSISMGDMMEKMYGDKSKSIVGILSSLGSIVSVSMQVLALGYVFTLILQTSPTNGMLLGGFIVILSTLR